MQNILDFYTDFENGLYTIDLNGHKYDRDFLEHSILIKKRSLAKYASKFNQFISSLKFSTNKNKFNILEKQTLQNSSTYRFLMMTLHLSRAEFTGGFSFDFTQACRSCGEYAFQFYADPTTKTIYLRKFPDSESYDLVPVESCTCKEINEFVSEIDVDTDLLFSNFFLTQDDEYFIDGSLSSINGLNQLTLDYGQKNIIFGQTGNMSVYIYEKDGQIDILESEVLDYYYWSDDESISSIIKDQIEKYKSWNYKGTVSCEVWRYMATSSSNLEKLNLKTDHYTPLEDAVVVPLESGRYQFKHNYRLTNNGLIMSTIRKLS